MIWLLLVSLVIVMSGKRFWRIMKYQHWRWLDSGHSLVSGAFTCFKPHQICSSISLSEITNCILWIALLCTKINLCIKIIFTEIFLRDDKFPRFHIAVPHINQFLKTFTSAYNFISTYKFLEPAKGWLKNNGDLNKKLFWTDHLHL